MELDEWYPLVEQQLMGLGLASRGRQVREIKGMLNGQTQLLSVFKATCTRSTHNFFKQLLWSCGLHLQKQVKLLLKGQVKLPLMSAKALDMSDMLACPNKLDRHLVRYVDVSQALMQGQLSISCATDKSSVCGLGAGLQNTVFVLPNNMAVFSPPQVPIRNNTPNLMLELEL
jgi:hypothetical protein